MNVSSSSRHCTGCDSVFVAGERFEPADGNGGHETRSNAEDETRRLPRQLLLVCVLVWQSVTKKSAKRKQKVHQTAQ